MKRNQFIRSAGIASLLIPATTFYSFKKLEDEPQLDKALV